MATTTSISRLAIAVVATALAIAASPAAAHEWKRGRAVLPHLGGVVLPPLPPLRVELWRERARIRTWGGHEVCGPRRYDRRFDRRFAGPEERRRPNRYGAHRGDNERRRHGEHGDRWR